MSTEEIRVKKVVDHAVVPQRQSRGAAGYDICAVEAGRIPPKGRSKVRTGLSWDLPPTVIGLVQGRSGLALRSCIEVVDSYVYPGIHKELEVNLVNNGDQPFEYQRGDRIAQLVFVVTAGCDVTLVDSLDPTERGEAGFGSTGTN
jgi:dUTP pyrophosphatase